MTIVVHPARPPKPNPWAKAAEGLASGLLSGLESHEKEASAQRDFERQNKQRFMQNLEARESAYQQQKQMQNALQGLEDIYSNPDLNEQQKLIGAYRQLSAHPELAKQLTGQLGQLSEGQREEDFLSQLMGGGRRQPAGGKIPASQFDDFEETEETPRKGGFDPTRWNDKQIEQLRAIKSKSPRAQTISNLAQQEYDRRQETKQTKKKYQEDVAPFKTALDTLDRMESLGKKGNLGIGTRARGIYSPEARKHAAEYERLGKSLIQYSTNIPIRNKQEFETLAHDLYDPSISDASREGILAAMRRIIQSSMHQYEQPAEEGNEIDLGVIKVPTEAGATRRGQKERPPLTSFLKG